MTLFDEWLQKTHELQVQAYGNDLTVLDPETRARKFMEFHTAAVVELGEMSEEIGWKPWASSRHLHREAFIKEAVDVLHFVANLLLLADCTDLELSSAYQAKMDVNRARQLEAGGYTGLNKCPHCRRAYDDPNTFCKPQSTVSSKVAWCNEVGFIEPLR